MVDDSQIGVTTSGNYAPSLEHGIALALVDRKVKLGTKVAIDVRGAMLEGVVVSLPFIAKK